MTEQRNETARGFSKGDRVRFDRFGEWLDGTVIAIRDGLLCIQYRDYGAVQWCNPDVHGVVKVDG